MRFISVAVACVVFGSVCGASIARAATLSDGSFANSDWSAAQVFSNTSSSFTAGQTASGGNPGAYRGTQHTWQGPGFLGVGQVFIATTYNPSVQGAIADLDYAWDAQYFTFAGTGGNPNAVRYTPLLLQGGNYYVTVATGQNALATGVWQHFNGGGNLTAADFQHILSDASTDGTHPDFSATGGVITFGFLSGNGSGVSGSHVTTSGIDNWSVNIDLAQVPEPATLALLGTSLLGLALRRREKP